MIGFTVVAVMLAIFGVIGLFGMHEKKQLTSGTASPVLASPTKGLTNVSKQLYKEYMSLPEDSRPFPEIVSILRAMDAKTSDNHIGLRRHFDNNWLPTSRVQNGSVDFTWSPFRQHCSVNHCDYGDYHRLHESIKTVVNEIAQKEKAILLAANQPGLDMLKELEDSLRSEAKIQRDVRHDIAGTSEPKGYGRWGNTYDISDY